MSPQQQNHLQAIVADQEHKLLYKYPKGQKENGGDLWDKPGMMENVEEEITDLITYKYTLRMQLQQVLDLLEASDAEKAKHRLAMILGPACG
jgi:hypothetical protein